jgi:hypothetical protein
MLSFAFQTAIADVDGTVEGEPCHPALVLILDLNEKFVRVIVPSYVLDGREDLLAVGTVVKLEGRVEETVVGPTHIATGLDLILLRLFAH